MDINVIIDSIYQVQEEEDKLELLDDLEKQICDKNEVIINSLKRIGVLIDHLLLQQQQQQRKPVFQSPKIVQKVFQIVHILLKVVQLGSELEQIFPQILPAIVTHLGNESDINFRKAAKSSLISYVKRTRNLEQVIRFLVKDGLASANYFVRQRALNVVPKLIMAEQSIFASAAGINDVRKLIENVIVRCDDSVASVRKEAGRVLYKIKEQTHENFEILVTRRLSSEHQIRLRKVLQKEEGALERNFEKYRDIFVLDFLQQQDNFEFSYFGGQQEYENLLKNEVPEEWEEIAVYFPKIGAKSVFWVHSRRRFSRVLQQGRRDSAPGGCCFRYGTVYAAGCAVRECYFQKTDWKQQQISEISFAFAAKRHLFEQHHDDQKLRA